MSSNSSSSWFPRHSRSSSSNSSHNKNTHRERYLQLPVSPLLPSRPPSGDHCTFTRETRPNKVCFIRSEGNKRCSPVSWGSFLRHWRRQRGQPLVLLHAAFPSGAHRGAQGRRGIVVLLRVMMVERSDRWHGGGPVSATSSRVHNRHWQGRRVSMVRNCERTWKSSGLVRKVTSTQQLLNKLHNEPGSLTVAVAQSQVYPASDC